MLDLDDTLYLERDYVRSGFEKVGQWVRENLQINDFAARAFAHFEAGRRGDIFDAVLEDCSCTVSRVDIHRMVSIYRRHMPKIQPLPDAREFLSFWRGKCAMALISDGPISSQRQKLSALGLEPYFELVVFTGIWARQYSKPHQRAFLVVQEHFQARGLTYLYVADNPAKDFQAPLALGWKTARIRRAAGIHSSREPHPGSTPGIEVADLSELTIILQSLIT